MKVQHFQKELFCQKPVLGNTKLTYHKEWTFATDFFVFFENLIWV